MIRPSGSGRTQRQRSSHAAAALSQVSDHCSPQQTGPRANRFVFTELKDRVSTTTLEEAKRYRPRQHPDTQAGFASLCSPCGPFNGESEDDWPLVLYGKGPGRFTGSPARCSARQSPYASALHRRLTRSAKSASSRQSRHCSDRRAWRTRRRCASSHPTIPAVRAG